MTESDTLRGAGTRPMQAVEGSSDDPRRQSSLNAPAPGPATNPGIIPPGVWGLLVSLQWVHELGLSVECEGCANDGEAGYCLGPMPSREQADLSDPDAGEEWGTISCHCGHSVVVIEYPARPEDGEWRCAGEDSEHWPKGDGLLAECGHCGWSPDDGEVVDYLLDGRLTIEEIADWHGGDYGRDVAARFVQLAADERDRRAREAKAS